MVVHGSEEADDGTSTPTQEIVWLHADHLGRPVAATDADGGTLWRSALLTPFGDDARPWLAANDNGSASVATALAALDGLGSLTQSLRFPGQYADAETRGANGTELSALTTLSHNHNRTYDPMLGRYLTPDPIGLAGGLNRYAYVGGNPVKDVDPTGLATTHSGVQVDLFALIGISFDFGIYTSSEGGPCKDQLERGIYIGVGFGIGFDLSIGFDAGASNGTPKDNFFGPYAELGGSVGPAGVDIRNSLGEGLSVDGGPELGIGPVGGHASFGGSLYKSLRQSRSRSDCLCEKKV